MMGAAWTRCRRDVRRPRREAGVTLYIDFSCRVCPALQPWVRSWWTRGGLKFRDWREVKAEAPYWDPHRMLLRVRDGSGEEWFLGAEAVLWLLKRGPFPYSLMGTVGSSPFVLPFVRAVYFVVARMRRRVRLREFRGDRPPGVRRDLQLPAVPDPVR